MSGSEHARPVWVYPSEADRLRKIARMLEDWGGLLGNTDAFLIQRIVQDLEAAPADPAEATKAAWCSVLHVSDPDVVTQAVLRALGHPTNNPTSGGTHE